MTDETGSDKTSGEAGKAGLPPRFCQSLVGSCRIEYELAPLKDGRYAMRVDYKTDHSGGGHGWMAFSSRKEALDAMLAGSLRYFSPEIITLGSCATNRDKSSAPKMLELLQPDNLFGFEEPDPLPREEWYPEMIADRIITMTLYLGWDLLDVVRGMDCKPISKSGNFFDIPLPDQWKPKGRYKGTGAVEDDDEGDPDDEE